MVPGAMEVGKMQARGRPWRGLAGDVGAVDDPRKRRKMGKDVTTCSETTRGDNRGIKLSVSQVMRWIEGHGCEAWPGG